MAPKSKKSKKVLNEQETESEPEVVTKASKIKKDDYIDMISVKYHINDPNHPFIKINGITGTLDLSKILDETPKEEVVYITLIFRKSLLNLFF